MNPPKEFTPGEWLAEEVVRRWLKQCGRGVRIFKGSRLIPPERISVGDVTQIDEGVRIFAGKGVEIGRHVHLAFDSSISGGGSCVVGDFAGIGAGVRLITGTERVDAGGLTNPTAPPDLRTVHRGRIEIGAHAVIFTGAIVLPDITVGEGAVVSAGAVVHHDLKPWAVYAGNPLVQVRVRDSESVLKAAQIVLEREASQ